ncbi:uncharacterized protein LOC122855036 [Aphidius gifuensis]|uniref:uncharacterized protein LOC122855036 n=1 Tax=Aphidius gifuensis TaxID=684658 RepID=UPI001CDD4ED3|nr:uncharacterized protein LOC122855036 [Aphidius gifuensis]
MDKSHNYRVNLTKWLPSLSLELELCFEEILVMCHVVDEFVQNIVILVGNIKVLDKKPYEKIMLLDQEINKVEDFITAFNSVSLKKLYLVFTNKIYKQKIYNLSLKIVRALRVMSKFCRNLIFTIVDHDSERDKKSLIIILRVVISHKFQ